MVGQQREYLTFYKAGELIGSSECAAFCYSSCTAFPSYPVAALLQLLYIKLIQRHWPSKRVGKVSLPSKANCEAGSSALAGAVAWASQVISGKFLTEMYTA